MELRGFDENLPGFDAREMSLSALPTLGPGGGRPVQFLLREDLDDVLSADRMVWPSIFKARVSLDRGPELRQPDWIGPNAPFWEDLNALCNAIPHGHGNEHPFWLIAAMWHSDLGFQKEERLEGKILGPIWRAQLRNTGTVRGGCSVLMSPILGSAASQIAGTTTLSVKVWPRNGHTGSIGIICSIVWSLPSNSEL
jgi:hypothetical protein